MHWFRQALRMPSAYGGTNLFNPNLQSQGGVVGLQQQNNPMQTQFPQPNFQSQTTFPGQVTGSAFGPNATFSASMPNVNQSLGNMQLGQTQNFTQLQSQPALNTSGSFQNLQNDSRFNRNDSLNTNILNNSNNNSVKSNLGHSVSFNLPDRNEMSDLQDEYKKQLERSEQKSAQIAW